VSANGDEEEGSQEKEEVGPCLGGEGVQPLPTVRSGRREVKRTVAKKKAAKKKK
jgi:hypothetical protein